MFLCMLSALRIKRLPYALPVAAWTAVLLMPHGITGISTAHADNDDIPDLTRTHIITDLTPYKKEEYFGEGAAKTKEEALEFKTIDNTHCRMLYLTVWCDTDSSPEYPGKHRVEAHVDAIGDIDLSSDSQKNHDFLAKGQTLLPENSSLIFPTPTQGVKPTICTTTHHSLTCYIQNTYGPKGDLTDDNTIRGFTINPTHSHTFAIDPSQKTHH